jgi:phage gpG-like protein
LQLQRRAEQVHSRKHDKRNIAGTLRKTSRRIFAPEKHSLLRSDGLQ